MTVGKDFENVTIPSASDITSKYLCVSEISFFSNLDNIYLNSSQQPAKNWASATTADSSYSSAPSSALYSEPKSNLYSDVVSLLMIIINTHQHILRDIEICHM